jgi:hypothetical protein
MNLENLNLVELNAQEVQEVEGGVVDLIVGLAIGLLLGWLWRNWPTEA